MSLGAAAFDRFYFAYLCYRQFRRTDGDVPIEREAGLVSSIRRLPAVFSRRRSVLEAKAVEIAQTFRNDWNDFIQLLTKKKRLPCASDYRPGHGRQNEEFFRRKSGWQAIGSRPIFAAILQTRPTTDRYPTNWHREKLRELVAPVAGPARHSQDHDASDARRRAEVDAAFTGSRRAR